jgi:hypothetical protein
VETVCTKKVVSMFNLVVAEITVGVGENMGVVAT